MPAEAYQPFYREDSRVSLSHSRDIAKAQTTLAGFGLNISDSSESVSRIGLLQKMLQHSSIFLSSKESIPTFKTKVTKSGYSYSQLQESAHHTRGNGVLSLPTPAATDYKRQKLSPAATDYKRQKLAPAALGRKSPHLVLYAALISAGVIKLSTPTTSQDFKRIRAQIPSERAGTHGTVLPGSLGRAFPSLIGRAIHPQFVEWMMAFPADWTNPDCKLSAMQLCRGVPSLSSKQSQKLKEEN